MRGKKRTQRIEPRFDAPARRSPGDIRVDESDRVVVAPARQQPKSASGERPARKRSTPAKPASAKSEAKRHGTRQPPGRKRGAGRGGQGGGSGGGSGGKPGAGGRWRALRRLIYWCFVLGIWGGIAVACIVGYYAVQLPQMSSWSVPARPPNARIVSVDG